MCLSRYGGYTFIGKLQRMCGKTVFERRYGESLCGRACMREHYGGERIWGGRVWGEHMCGEGVCWKSVCVGEHVCGEGVCGEGICGKNMYGGYTFVGKIRSHKFPRVPCNVHDLDSDVRSILRVN